MGEVDTFSKSGWMEGQQSFFIEDREAVLSLSALSDRALESHGEGYLIRLVPGVQSQLQNVQNGQPLAPDKRDLNRIQNSPFSTKVLDPPLANNNQSRRWNAHTASPIRLGVGVSEAYLRGLH
ncbi:hypothetical protein PAAG_02234 [Paracoccidioides lutzii Pb01]|uniref:Uncharacterized protein n=1 Tax=Paracoccidioides lutzii (strain ATCC MYA-826 / Pb01) TaxID=502779 RepID=C1GVF7_PARBA|nr:hypothetical protein PAAG_02234 [Paracoccidioides lutzii Pb01]EEH40179.1 hypothetical protein PAAG_02234 [Paracoccidioides lutzii Pb01]